MSANNTAKGASRSGIEKRATGESYIPSSTRADGSVRKEIRVKPGYKPPEDVEVYKNRTAQAFKSRFKGGVPGAESVEPAGPEGGSAAANKNAKRREARKKAAAAGTEGESPKANGTNGTNGVTADTKETEKSEEVVDPEVEKAKEARKLAKKLRQARELSDKKEKGDDLLPEQFAKVIKMNELIRQLDSMGFDNEGENKGEAKAKD